MIRVLFVLILILGLCAIGCQDKITSDIAGLYIDSKDSRNFLKLEADGTYKTVLGIEGEWERHGDEVIFMTPFGMATFKIKDGELVSPEQVYIKKK